MIKLCKDHTLIWPMGVGGGPTYYPINPTASHLQTDSSNFRVPAGRGRAATQRFEKGSEKVLDRVLGKGSQKGSEKGPFSMGFTVKKGSEKGSQNGF